MMDLVWLEAQHLWWLIPVTFVWGWYAWKRHAAGHGMLSSLWRGLWPCLLVLALAQPAVKRPELEHRALVAVDVSHSLDAPALEQLYGQVQQDLATLATGHAELYLFAGEVQRLDLPLTRNAWDEAVEALRASAGNETRFDRLFATLRPRVPRGERSALLLLTDGVDSYEWSESEFSSPSLEPFQIQVRPLAAAPREEIRVLRLESGRAEHQYRVGETVELRAHVQATTSGSLQLHLFENDRQLGSQSLTISEPGREVMTWTVQPSVPGLHHYRLEIEGEKVTSEVAGRRAERRVDLTGPLQVLWVDGEEGAEVAMPVTPDQMQVQRITAEAMPELLEGLASYDAVVLASVSADQLGEQKMGVIREYVEGLGGGLLMLGSPETYALGGYIGTPIEALLPLSLQGKDQEEKQNSALALVIDRSGSMAGEKLEMAKSASLASAQVLTNRDFLGVYAFDNDAHTIVPMLRLGARANLQKQVANLSSGGGTNLYSALKLAHDALLKVPAKVRHAIVLSDGQTTGEGYESLVTQMKGQGISISTVSIGEGAHVDFLQTLANLGGGQAYTATEISQVLGFFTQDTLRHMGRMLREEPVSARWVKGNRLMASWSEEAFGAPPLLGYVLTQFRPRADRILETAVGDPLLASWQVGSGRVTAFTSDANGRWSSLWQTRWADYRAFWGEILRRTARSNEAKDWLELRRLRRQGTSVLQVKMDPRLTNLNLEDPHTSAVNVSFVEINPRGTANQAAKNLPLAWRRTGMHEIEINLPEAQAKQHGWVLLRVGEARASMIWEPSAAPEVVNGYVNVEFLNRLAKASEGRVLDTEESASSVAFERSHFMPLQVGFIATALAVYLVELVLRRWRRRGAIWA